MARVADSSIFSSGPPLAPPEVPRDDALSDTQSLKAAVAQAGNQSALGVGAGATSSQEPQVIRRKLNGFVGFSNLPQQWHQTTVRQGFSLNIMLVGASGLGKSTLLNTLFEVPLHSLNPQSKNRAAGSNGAQSSAGDDTTADASDANASSSGSAVNGDDHKATVSIQTQSTNLEENGVRLHLTVIDTPGFGDNVDNLDSWKPIIDEIDRRYDAQLENEAALNRTTKPDSLVHAVLYFIEPSGHSLNPLDVVVMKKLHEKVNLIPIIAKADLLTDEELVRFKKLILDDISFQGINIFRPPIYEDDDEETTAETSDLLARLPFAVVGSTQLVPTPDGRTVFGRSYPWGVVEVNNEEHNDFVKLRALLIRNHLEDLRETTSEKLFENYRTEKLLAQGHVQDHSVFREVDPEMRREEERALHAQRLARMEQEMRQVFQSKVTEKEAKLKKSENELFTKHKEIKEQLNKQRADLEAKKARLEQVSPAVDEKKRKGFSLR